MLVVRTHADISTALFLYDHYEKAFFEVFDVVFKEFDIEKMSEKERISLARRALRIVYESMIEEILRKTNYKILARDMFLVLKVKERGVGFA